MLLAGKRLNGSQKEQFRKALNDAFKYFDFKQMLGDNLDKDSDDIILPVNIGFPGVLDRVIEKAEEESWTAQLLQAALSVRRDDIPLMQFAQQFGPVVTTPPLKGLVPKRPGFERAITPVPMYNLDHLVQRLYELAGRICCIEDGSGHHLGTGFLVGPDMVMTNYHVWEAVPTPAHFVCRFDHGLTAEPITYRLTEKDYKIHLSPYNPQEEQPGVLPSTNELDYALLRLAEAAGNQSVKRPDQEHITQRGWLTPYSPLYSFPPETPLYIFHYPQVSLSSPATLRVSLETSAIIGMNKNKTRVTYRTNTLNGSSGAPCFTANWDLVALHHFGDPNDHPKYNQGVPFTAIKSHLEQHLHKDIFIPFTNSFNNNSTSEVSKPEGYEIAGYSPTPDPPISAEPPPDDDRPGNVIDIRAGKTKPGTVVIASEQSFSQQARQLFASAQTFADEAYTHLTNNAPPSPAQFREAAQALEKAKQSAHSLRALLLGALPDDDSEKETSDGNTAKKILKFNTDKNLQKICNSTSTIPAEILQNLMSINNSINTIVEQIDLHLIPCLNWNQVKDFSSLQEALREIDKLLPEQNNPQKLF
jgi:hypothetical protein